MKYTASTIKNKVYIKKVYIKHYLPSLLSQRCQYSIPVRGWGEEAEPWKETSPKRGKNLFGGYFKTSSQTVEGTPAPLTCRNHT